MDSPAPPGLNRLSDYRAPDWRVPAVSLHFLLDAERTIVRATLLVERNGQHSRPLLLDGDELETLAVRLNGAEQPLPNSARRLSIAIEGDRATIETTVAIHPAANSRLMGLYASGGNLITQCEAEGFRRISWFPDRPDVLSRYHVRLEADRSLYPVLLANGDRAATGDLPDNRHFAEWQDPHPKPCYLFALVAGPLSALTDSFTTRSGRVVDLAIWVAPADVPRCHHAMHSLKQAMRFDEERYGREYDLDLFNIVAVHDFNFGAMENKGLNIFNARYILADAETATDFDFDSIAAVVAHEYFHNWSGNRVTCRDWFQLSLKEGFTVFRDQQFSESIGSAAVKRIESIRTLRSFQFPEDEGPLAHAVQPEAYLEISNFYTATVYNKGAELARMIHRLLGPDAFRRGSDRFFADNDGKAATVADFLAAMAGQGLDSARFRHWYSQPGTPRLTVAAHHDAANSRLTLNLAQSNPASAAAAPLPIPLDIALFSASGEKLAETRDAALTERFADLVFDGISAPPVLSLNRGFTAPVIVSPEPGRAALALLARAEDDPFARYEAMQQLMLSALSDSIGSGRIEGEDDVATAVARLLEQWRDDPALTAETILIPSESLIGERMPLLDPAAVHSAREGLRRALLTALETPLTAIWNSCTADPGSITPQAKGLRRLKSVTLSLLTAADSAESAQLAYSQFIDATTMTDRMAALTALSHSHHPQRREALRRFHDRYAAMPEVMDKWFGAQAASIRADVLAEVRALEQHPLYSQRNPNRLRALVLGYAMNQPRFHRKDGAGYAFVEAQVRAADAINPQSAARLAAPLTRWRRLVPPYADAMRASLERLAASPTISRDLLEVVSQSLK